MKLTNSSIDRLEPPIAGYTLHWDQELSGFGVRVTAAGSKSFVVQTKVNGKARRVTLGKYGVYTAEQARKLAKSTLGDMARGTDPSAEKRQQKARKITLEDVAEDYLKYRRTRSGLPLKDRTKADIGYHLKTNFSTWQNKPIASITREMVQRRYGELARRSVAQANQAFRVLAAIINYAAASCRDQDGGRIISENPVAVLREANMLRSVRAKSGAVPLDSLGKWWSAVQAARAEPSISTSTRSAVDLVAILSLTGLRLGEARALRWSQIDLKGRSLTLKDTKNRTDVVLPLSELAAQIIDARPRVSDYLFPSRRNSSKLPHLKNCGGQLKVLAERTGIEVTAHDLRRTFRAVAAACDVELWRCKALMNHKQNDDVTLAHYTDLSDVRNLKREADRIADFYLERQLEHERSIGE